MPAGWCCDGVASHAGGGGGVEIILVVNARETRISFSSMKPLPEGLGKKLVEYYTVAKDNMQNNCKKEQEIQTPGLAY